jgi:glycosyltransferase involved in cell wall biosynthesis
MPFNMKILQILPELNAGGVERGTLEVGRHLVEQGHESLVVSNGGQLVEQLEREGSRHIRLAVHRKSPFTLRQIPVLRRLLVEEKPDILHLRSRVPAWIAWLAWRKLPVASRPRLVTTVHGFYSVNMYSEIMTRGERVIAVSSATREYIVQNYPRTPRDRIVVIPRGVPEVEIQPGYQAPEEWRTSWQAQYPWLGDKQVLLLPGRITRLKGHPDFFRLIAELKARGLRIHGLVVGDTHPKKRGYLDELKKQVHSLGIADEVTFIGHRGDLREIMAVSDLVLNLSRQPESFGRTTLEALAIGKPVVAYAHGGIREQLELIFPAGAVPLGDRAPLFSTAAKILSEGTKPGPIPSIFTREEMCRSTLEVYQEIAQKR